MDPATTSTERSLDSCQPAKIKLLPSEKTCPRVLLGVTGSVATIKLLDLLDEFTKFSTASQEASEQRENRVLGSNRLLHDLGHCCGNQECPALF